MRRSSALALSWNAGPWEDPGVTGHRSSMTQALAAPRVDGSELHGPRSMGMSGLEPAAASGVREIRFEPPGGVLRIHNARG